VLAKSTAQSTGVLAPLCSTWEARYTLEYPTALPVFDGALYNSLHSRFGLTRFSVGWLNGRYLETQEEKGLS